MLNCCTILRANCTVLLKSSTLQRWRLANISKLAIVFILQTDGKRKKKILDSHRDLQWRQWKGAPSQVKRSHPNESVNILRMNLRDHRSSGKAEWVEVVAAMTKKVITLYHFWKRWQRWSPFGVKRVTPSVIAPGDTNLSDATGIQINLRNLVHCFCL